MKYGPVEACQVCEARGLRSVLFAGFLPPVNLMRPIGRAHDAEPWFPAEMLSCPRCHLVQLGYAADPNVLFPPDYPYTSGSTRILRENFAELFREARERLGLAAGDLVVDIGSNDGTLLGNWKEGGFRVVGIEPTQAGELARAKGIETLTTFFDAKAVASVLAKNGRPKLVTAANVFAHIHDTRAVMAALVELLGDDGVFISESHYLRDLVETLQYDTIYHEHLRYYSLTSLRYFLNAYGLEVFHAKRIPTHGGSIRVYASRSRRFAVDPSVERLLSEERAAGLAGEDWIPGFRERVFRSKLDLYALLARVTDGGRRRVVGIGAPSRASTLVNFVGLDDGTLSCVYEIATSKKVGKYLPGRSIPVLDEANLYREQPPFALLLSWHIADELMRNLKRSGFRGDFIIPLPEPRVVANAAVSV